MNLHLENNDLLMTVIDFVVVQNITVCIPKGSPPNGTTGKSVALPAGASWYDI